MGADRLIYIRTDGNAKIAAGHLVRCLSVAQSCIEQGMEVCFLLSDEESQKLLLNFLSDELKNTPRLHIHVLVTAAYEHLEQELSEVISLMLDTPDAVYLLDSYYVTETYITILNSYVKIAYIDDLMLFDYPVELVVNYDVIPDHAKTPSLTMSDYIQAYQRAGKALLGAAYTPLRSQFRNSAVTIKEKVTDILLTTGGSDPYHFCVEFLKRYVGHITLRQNEASKIPANAPAAISLYPTSYVPTLHIVIGKYNTDAETLRTLAACHPFVRLWENVTDMAALMKKCDLAISASGTTLYELCALGVPAISFTMADNQLTSAKSFDAAKAITCAGDIREDMAGVTESIFNFLSQMENLSKRKDAHQTMRSLVDGNGSARIAAELSRL